MLLPAFTLKGEHPYFHHNIFYHLAFTFKTQIDSQKEHISKQKEVVNGYSISYEDASIFGFLWCPGIFLCSKNSPNPCLCLPVAQHPKPFS